MTSLMNCLIALWRAVRVRWLVFVPVLTVMLFGGLCALTFLELRVRPPSSGSKTVREISAEILARYQHEASQLEEMRRKKREGVTVESILEALSPRKKDQALPTRASLLADFRALARRDAEAPLRLTRSLVPLWRASIADRKSPEYVYVLFDSLLSQCAVLLDCPVKLTSDEEAELFELAERCVVERPESAGGVLLLIRGSNASRNVSALKALRKKTRNAQHQEELRRLIEGASSVASAG